MNLTKENLDLIQQFREDIEGWFFGDYSGFEYKLEIETEYEDEFRWNVTILGYEKEIATLYFRYEDKEVQINQYEDMWEELDETTFFKHLFFYVWGESRKKCECGR